MPRGAGWLLLVVMAMQALAAPRVAASDRIWEVLPFAGLMRKDHEQQQPPRAARHQSGSGTFIVNASADHERQRYGVRIVSSQASMSKPGTYTRKIIM